MTDIAAALGLVQLERAEELLAARRSIAAAYATGFRASEAKISSSSRRTRPTAPTRGTCTSFASGWIGWRSIGPR